MGESTAVPDDQLNGDPDARWRRDYVAPESVDEAIEEPAEPSAEPVADDGERPEDVTSWSREEAERPREPWVPQRPERTPWVPPQEEESKVATVSGQPTSAAKGDVLLAGLGVVLAVIGAGVVAFLLVTREQTVSVEDRTTPLIASAAESEWAVDLDGPIAAVGVGEELVLIASEGVVTAYEVDGGAARWATDVGEGDIDRVAVIDGVPVAEIRRPSAGTVAVALDGVTGDQLWTSVGDEGVVTISGPDDGAIVMRRIQEDFEAFVDILDPITGEAVDERLQLSGVTAAGDDMAVQPEERDVAVWSRTDQAVATEPVGAFNLRMVAAYDGVVVALDREGRIILFDESGRRADELRFESDAFGEFVGRQRLVGVVPGTDIAIVSSGTSVGFGMSGDAIEPLWTVTGTVGTPVGTESGPVATVIGPTATGEIRESLIDPVDGTTLTVTDADGKRERAVVLGHNAYVVSPSIGSSERVLTAFGYDHEPIWTLDLAPNASYAVGYGSTVVAESSLDGSRVILAR